MSNRTLRPLTVIVGVVALSLTTSAFASYPLVETWSYSPIETWSYSPSVVYPSVVTYGPVVSYYSPAPVVRYRGPVVSSGPRVVRERWNYGAYGHLNQHVRTRGNGYGHVRYHNRW